MDDNGRSDLAQMPPQDPRGPRLRRWIPLTILLGGLVLLGVLIRFVWDESPPLDPKKPPTRPATEQTPSQPPSVLNELSAAAKRREEPESPAAVVQVPTPDPAMAQLLAEALAREKAWKEELESLKALKESSKDTPAKKDEKRQVPPNPQAEAEARRRAGEEARAAKEIARRKREEDAAAKRARVIWERKTDASAVGTVKTVKSPYTLMPGWMIPCSLKYAMSSRAPAPIVAKVTQNVYDSATGHHLLIPQDATLMGDPVGGTVFGDDTMQGSINQMVVGNQIYTMGKAGLQDVTGQGGLKDLVETFWARAILSVGLTGVLRGSATAVQSGSDNAQERIAGTVAQQSAAESTRQIQQLINISPRLTIRQGYHCLMTVRESISFLKPYTPIDAQRDSYRTKHGW